MRSLLICGWEGCFKGKLEQRAGRNLPGKSQARSTGFNGRPAWLPDHHCLPHTGTDLSHTSTIMVRVTPMPLAMSTLPQPRWLGLIQKGITEGEGKRDAQTDCQREQLWLEEECGPDQPRGPMLITANFSSTKQASETLQFHLSFMPWQFDVRLPLCLTHERIHGEKKQTTPHIYTPNRHFPIQPASKDAIFNKMRQHTVCGSSYFTQ